MPVLSSGFGRGSGFDPFACFLRGLEGFAFAGAGLAGSGLLNALAKKPAFENNPNNSLCKQTTSPKYGTSIVNIVNGNGSSSCMAGWFVRYVTSGPVGSGQINNGETIGVQLIR